MVLDEDFNPLHRLTEEGKIEYQKILKAISKYKQQHPFRWKFI